MIGWNRIKIGLIRSRKFLVLWILAFGCVPEVRADFSDSGLASIHSPVAHLPRLPRLVEEGDQEAEPQTIERVSGEAKGPRIPDPWFSILSGPWVPGKGNGR